MSHYSSSSDSDSTIAHILVADDFVRWRVQIRQMLRTRPEWQIVCETCDGLQAVEKAAELHPDLILLDSGMPNLNGIKAAKRIRRVSPDSKIIFITPERTDMCER